MCKWTKSSLERIFVELIISPQTSHQASANILVDTPDSGQNRRIIWDYLRGKKKESKKYVILGAPGSGKTTLLKNITLVLAGKRKQKSGTSDRGKIPILLFLREHADIIDQKPDILLPELITRSLEKYQLASPPTWFQMHLSHGDCIVMLDGLDEVFNTSIRRKVVAWTEKQMLAYPDNHFIVTSRPFGYRDNQLEGVTVLEVSPFNHKQVEQFINNWYLANEIQSLQKDDDGVRMKAKDGAEDLLSRLKKTTTLLDLAVNPLLLTMIATVHRYRSSLPGRRVELYREICEVFLGKRQGARGLELPLTPAQKQSVLQPLAYYMMCHGIRNIDGSTVLAVIKERLSQVSPQSTVEEFLKMIENSSGLLLEQGNGDYIFAHKTFQEYLASVHVLEQNLEEELLARIEEDGWHECIRLYAAQTDASPIIEACLNHTIPSASAISLAIACEDEAREVNQNVRQKLEDTLFEGVESEDKEIRRLIAEALLNLNFRNMLRIDDNIAISKRLVNHAELQVFLDDMAVCNRFFHPDHWNSERFPTGMGLQPAMGIPPSTAMLFCKWLTERESGEWIYRLPTRNEANAYTVDAEGSYWIKDGNDNLLLVPQLPNCEINLQYIEHIIKDDLFAANHLERFIGFDVTRILHSARQLLTELLNTLKQASLDDLGVNRAIYDKTNWYKAVMAAKELSGLMYDVKERGKVCNINLFSGDASRASHELATKIELARERIFDYFQSEKRQNKRTEATTKVATHLQSDVKNLGKYISLIDLDIESLRKYNHDMIIKITGGFSLPFTEVVELSQVSELYMLVKLFSENDRILSNELMKIYIKGFSGNHFIDSAMEALHNPDLDHQDFKTWVNRRKVLGWFARTAIIISMESLANKQKLPIFWGNESQLIFKKSEIIKKFNTLKELFLSLVILEGRSQKMMLPYEGIRLVRESNK